MAVKLFHVIFFTFQFRLKNVDIHWIHKHTRAKKKKMSHTESVKGEKQLSNLTKTMDKVFRLRFFDCCYCMYECGIVQNHWLYTMFFRWSDDIKPVKWNKKNKWTSHKKRKKKKLNEMIAEKQQRIRQISPLLPSLKPN